MIKNKRQPNIQASPPTPSSLFCKALSQAPFNGCGPRKKQAIHVSATLSDMVSGGGGGEAEGEEMGVF